MAEVGRLVAFADADRLGDLTFLELMAVEHLLQPVVNTALNGCWFAYSVGDQGQKQQNATAIDQTSPA